MEFKNFELNYSDVSAFCRKTNCQISTFFRLILPGNASIVLTTMGYFSEYLNPEFWEMYNTGIRKDNPVSSVIDGIIEYIHEKSNLENIEDTKILFCNEMIRIINTTDATKFRAYTRLKKHNII